MSARILENPFERFDLEPTAGVEAITEHMREIAADAPESQRQVVRDSWEALTLQPQRRIAAALSTFVDRDPARIVPPSARRHAESAAVAPPDALPEPVLPLHAELPPARDIAPTLATDPLLESLRT